MSFSSSFSIITPYKDAASLESVPSSISSTPIKRDFLANNLENWSILPAKVEISSLTFCGSSKIASNSLKEPILLPNGLIFIGSKYLAKIAAVKMLFKSILFPPAFTPVINKTLPVNSTLTRFGS